LKFKIDENLPAEYVAILRAAGYEAESVDDEGLGSADDGVIADRVQAEERALLTLDLGFADIRTYPPQQYSGLIVFRSRTQDKIMLLSLLRRLLPVLRQRSPVGQLWIVESDRIRFREGW
jgi:predicted nuclease of predicted toxin-antitoxin system